MSSFADLVRGMAAQLWASFRINMEDEFDGLSEDELKLAREAIEDMARLVMRGLGGENVEREVAHTKAQILAWKYVGSERVRDAIKEALSDVAAFAGKTILKMIL